MNNEEIIDRIECRALAVYERIVKDERAAQASWSEERNPGKDPPSLFVISVADLPAYMKHLKYKKKKDLDYQYLVGVAHGVGWADGHEAISDLWQVFYDQGKTEVIVVLSSAFEGVCGWYN